MIISTGIPQADREKAAELYWEAFGQKLGHVLGPKHRAHAFIAKVLRADHGICAHSRDGRLLGVAGFKTSQGALVGGSFADMRDIYGIAGAAIRITLLTVLERETDNERFLMDGIFVAPDARGKGVGTALLGAIAIEARKRGYRHVRLDVIDSNTRAKTLYLQEGFEVVKTQSIGPLRYVFGFKAATTMVREV